LSNVVAIASGDLHTLALKSDGTLAVWGYFVVFDRTIQVPFWMPAGVSNVVAVATGSEHGMVLKQDGRVLVWGYAFTPGLTNAPASASNVVAIAAGALHCLALRNDGTVVAWGNSSAGQAQVPAGLTDVVAIAAGQYHSVALRRDGTVVAWGAGTNTVTQSPHYGQSRVPAGLGNVVRIAAGSAHTLALRDVRPWGMHLDGPVAAPGTFSVSVPTAYHRVYALEFKQDLDQPTWSLSRLGAGNGGPLWLSDLQATNAQRFYRVKPW
jgi:alpha-tubulin suppressor-like RCC1 family protein